VPGPGTPGSASASPRTISEYPSALRTMNLNNAVMNTRHSVSANAPEGINVVPLSFSISRYASVLSFCADATPTFVCSAANIPRRARSAAETTAAIGEVAEINVSSATALRIVEMSAAGRYICFSLVVRKASRDLAKSGPAAAKQSVAARGMGTLTPVASLRDNAPIAVDTGMVQDSSNSKRQSQQRKCGAAKALSIVAHYLKSNT